MNQLALHDSDRIIAKRRFQSRDRVVRERVDVDHFGIKWRETRLQGLFPGSRQREQRLAAEPAPQREYIVARELARQTDAQRMFDRRGAADSGNHARQPGQLEESFGQFGSAGFEVAGLE
jgi:hypothetical protein